jgi:hypothetical protein
VHGGLLTSRTPLSALVTLISTIKLLALAEQLLVRATKEVVIFAYLLLAKAGASTEYVGVDLRGSP